MLNLGMTEIIIFAIIALVVLGPEKLPEAARFAGKWYGKLKRMISNVQNDIDRELRMSELREQMEQELERIKQLEQKMQMQLDEMQQSPSSTQTKQTLTPSTIRYIQLPQEHLKNRACVPFLDDQKSSMVSSTVKEFRAAI